jgi:hypothetical protein
MRPDGSKWVLEDSSYRQQLEANPALKPSAKLYRRKCIEALLKSWPGLSEIDVRKIGHKDGGALAMKVYGHLRDHHSVDMAKKVSFGSLARIFHALSGLRRAFVHRPMHSKPCPA